MSSQVVTLAIEQGLANRHGSLLSVCAQGVYQRGLKHVALTLDRDPGNLTRELSGNGRHLSVESLERYIAATGDLAPVHYLIERYLLNPERAADDAHRVQVLQQMQALMASLDR